MWQRIHLCFGQHFFAHERFLFGDQLQREALLFYHRCEFVSGINLETEVHADDSESSSQR